MIQNQYKIAAAASSSKKQQAAAAASSSSSCSSSGLLLITGAAALDERGVLEKNCNIAREGREARAFPAKGL